MDNLKQPAHPTIESRLFDGIVEIRTKDDGFTKLELASLMIAQGYIAAGAYENEEQEGAEIARCSVNIAKSVLEEANK